jgi:integrase
MRKQKTFADVAKAYLKIKQNKSTKTKALIKYILEDHLLPYFGKRRISSISVFELRSYVAFKSKRYKVYNHLKYFKAIIKLASEMDIDVRDFSGVECPDDVSERLRVFSLREVLILLWGARARRLWNLRLVIYISWSMGLRKSEILNLRWEWVDLTHGVLRLPAKYQKKTKRTKDHVMPISRVVRRIFEARHRRNPQLIYVFQGRTGLPFTDIDRSWDRLRKRVGVLGSFHSLRATCASRLCNAGVAVSIVCKLLRMTEGVLRRHYLGVDIEVARAALDRHKRARRRIA